MTCLDRFCQIMRHLAPNAIQIDREMNFIYAFNGIYSAFTYGTNGRPTSFPRNFGMVSPVGYSNVNHCRYCIFFMLQRHVRLGFRNLVSFKPVLRPAIYNCYPPSITRTMSDSNGDSPKKEKKTYHKKASGPALKTVEKHSKDHELKLYGSCFW